MTVLCIHCCSLYVYIVSYIILPTLRLTKFLFKNFTTRPTTATTTTTTTTTATTTTTTTTTSATVAAAAANTTTTTNYLIRQMLGFLGLHRDYRTH